MGMEIKEVTQRPTCLRDHMRCVGFILRPPIGPQNFREKKAKILPLLVNFKCHLISAVDYIPWSIVAHIQK